MRITNYKDHEEDASLSPVSKKKNELSAIKAAMNRTTSVPMLNRKEDLKTIVHDVFDHISDNGTKQKMYEKIVEKRQR